MISYENFSRNLNVEVQIFWKISSFQCYWWKYLKIVQFPKVSVKMKKFKIFYEAQMTASRSKEIMQAPPDKSWRKFLYGDTSEYTEAVARRCSVKKVFCRPCNFIKKETLAQVFSCEYREISKNTFFSKTPAVAAP